VVVVKGREEVSPASPHYIYDEEEDRVGEFETDWIGG